jgi:adenylate kinase
MKNNLICVLIGAPGAGKGTQAKNVANHFKCKLISTGDILRENVENKTVLGLEAKKYIDNGNLAPAQIVVSMIKNVIKSSIEKKDASDNNFLFDGFPRDLEQNKLFEQILAQLNLSIKAVIYINIEDDVVYERLTNRRVCPKCNRVYHLKFNPPKFDNLCDDCKVALITREDDKIDVIKKRLEVYKQLTEPLIEYYRKKNKVIEINGNKDAEEVLKDIISGINCAKQ